MDGYEDAVANERLNLSKPSSPNELAFYEVYELARAVNALPAILSRLPYINIYSRPLHEKAEQALKAYHVNWAPTLSVDKKSGIIWK